MQEDLQTILDKERTLSESKRQMSKYLSGAGFAVHKITDNPTDDLEMVNRKYVNLNGTMAERPTSANIGQHYFPTDIGIPMTFNGTNWVNGVGSIIAS